MKKGEKGAFFQKNYFFIFEFQAQDTIPALYKFATSFYMLDTTLWLIYIRKKMIIASILHILSKIGGKNSIPSRRSSPPRMMFTLSDTWLHWYALIIPGKKDSQAALSTTNDMLNLKFEEIVAILSNWRFFNFQMNRSAWDS